MSIDRDLHARLIHLETLVDSGRIVLARDMYDTLRASVDDALVSRQRNPDTGGL
jgi:hypothetical protein